METTALCTPSRDISSSRLLSCGATVDARLFAQVKAGYVALRLAQPGLAQALGILCKTAQCTSLTPERLSSVLGPDASQRLKQSEVSRSDGEITTQRRKIIRHMFSQVFSSCVIGKAYLRPAYAA